jgi:hypothetical protein
MKNINESISLMSYNAINQINPTNEECQNMREVYLELVTTHNPIDLFEKLKNNMQEILNVSNKPHEVEISIDKTFNLINLPIGIGRQVLDKQIFGTSDQSMSRLHCIIINCEDKIYVIDYWSVCGTCVKQDNIEHFSFVGNRKSIILDKYKPFTLTCGATSIGFNTPKCVICKSSPRYITLKCGHNLMCQECFDTLNETSKVCPYCNKDMLINKYEYATMTYLPPSKNQK